METPVAARGFVWRVHARKHEHNWSPLNTGKARLVVEDCEEKGLGFRV